MCGSTWKVVRKMRYFYDMHLHSCLSPCGDNDMTPYNLVNMAALSELDFIALTDHNTCKNCPSAMKIAEKIGITLICGMELCTAEEIHVVCLFPDLESAMAFDECIYPMIPDIPNKPHIFGEQLIMDTDDNIIDIEKKLLITATNISITDVPKLVGRFGGVCYPAHIDKSSYSVLASLGSIPPECNFKAVEISAKGDVAALKSEHELLNRIPLILSSDAHYLEDINPRRAYLELDECTPSAVINALSGNCKGFGRG